MRKHIGFIAVAGVAVALVAGGGGYALAAGSAAPPAATRGCVGGSARTLNNVFENASGFKGCTTSQGFAVSLSGAGTQGPAGPAGPKGATGPSGVQAVVNSSLTATASVPTGGSFNSKSVQVGTADLPAAGTYEISINAQVEPNTDTAAGVNAQFFVYNQVKNPSFTGDVLNVGTDVAPFLTTNSSQHDTYANGTQLVTVEGPTTLHIYGFGYDNDGGASDFNLIAGSVSAVQLTPAT